MYAGKLSRMGNIVKTVKVFSLECKPEPIMLSVLPIIPSRISHNFTHFVSMSSPIIPVIFFFIVSVTVSSTVYINGYS